MSVNFPLFLMVATAVAGLLWLLDIWLLKPKRLLAVAAFNAELSSNARTKAQSQSSPETELAVEKLLKEPVVIEYAISFFPVLLIVLVLRSFLAEPFQIPTGSMIPTLKVGDFILVNKYSYGIRLPAFGTKIIDVGMPETGDVMVFIPPHKDEYFIKRVVGLPGDKIIYKGKKLTVNGVEQKQIFKAQIPFNSPEYKVIEETLGDTTHMIHTVNRGFAKTQEWIVPAGHYFMMGDNRDLSSDSRYWGTVPEDNIVGQAFAVWMHKEPGFNLPSFSYNKWIE
ncbi:MAG: signal peptidase I [Pseudomonadales bacterium]|nr:signal peptidase I [Pseudomonadales bacterium]